MPPDKQNCLDSSSAIPDSRSRGLNPVAVERDLTLAERDASLERRHGEATEQTRKIYDLQRELAAVTKEKNELAGAYHSVVNSNCWRLSAPLRKLADALKFALQRHRIGRVFYRVLVTFRAQGPAITVRKAADHLKRFEQWFIRKPWEYPLTEVSVDKGEKILIIAELSIPQCKKYRVDQKVEMLASLGYSATVVSWTDAALCRQFLQTHGLAIFYRTPGFANVMALISEAKRLGVPVFFDIDDLIFDKKLLLKNKNLTHLTKEDYEGVLSGAHLYQKALAAADHYMSSTTCLAKQMGRFCKGESCIIRNCLDQQLFTLAKECKKLKKEAESIRIFYGSGTSTHDVDFKVAEDALVRILEKHRRAELVICGPLSVSNKFSGVEDQVRRLPFMAAEAYYKAISTFDINIAPLEAGIFNEAKSNIKFLEASVFAIPTIASPAAEFRAAIVDDENGLLASTTEYWFAALDRLVSDPDLRARIGAAARQSVQETYAVQNMAQRSLKPLLDNYLPHQTSAKKKILVVNVLFSPISFGGATIIAEQMAQRVQAHPDFEVAVFTGFWEPGSAPIYEYGLTRYEANGLPIFAVRFPENMTPDLDYDNPHMQAVFGDVLEAVNPDLVHFHSIQQLSAALANACLERHIPYIITLHDAWWLCARQFGVTAQGESCHQYKLERRICKACWGNDAYIDQRQAYLEPVLGHAAKLLAPSEYQAAFYRANGIPPQKIQVNKNGIFPPQKIRRRRPRNDERLTFAYLGGKCSHKGYYWLKDIFESIPQANYELIVVDLDKKLGSASISPSEWDIAGALTLSDGYENTPSGLDDFFQNVDVLLFPSQWKESFGLTVREALIRDRWVVSTTAGGVEEDICDGVNGHLIDMDSPDKFKDAIEYLLGYPDGVRHHQNPLKDKLTTLADQADDLVTIYNTVLNSADMAANE
jgi:glycosyltransferase involved in cell wall biosynthesis